MKAKFLWFGALVVAVFTVSSFNKNVEPWVQDEQVIEAIYDGHEDYGYNFIVTDEEGEYTITFQKVDDTVLKAIDLTQEALIGAKFKITYTSIVEVTTDDDGYEDETEINTITKLEKL